MNEREFARKIVETLDRSAAELRPGTVYRLRQARATALDAVGDTVAAGELATAQGSAGGAFGGGRAAAVRWLCLGLAVAALGLGYQQWHTVQQVHEFEDLDMHLLASDLPIDAYLDGGFQNWLRTSFER
ncbi:MAG TPA: DUF3619 family protein [Usitatibacter sp.]|nr:DUF3619 family protein [Usitatibacter sp.]